MNTDNVTSGSLTSVRFLLGQIASPLATSKPINKYHTDPPAARAAGELGTDLVAGLKVVAELDGASAPRSVFVHPGLAWTQTARAGPGESGPGGGRRPAHRSPSFPFSPAPGDEAALPEAVQNGSPVRSTRRTSTRSSPC